MSAKPRTPPGWRRLKYGELRCKNDRVWRSGMGPWQQVSPCTVGIQFLAHEDGRGADYPIIRRKTARRPKVAIRCESRSGEQESA